MTKTATGILLTVLLAGTALPQVQDYSRRRQDQPLTNAETARALDSALRLLNAAGRQVETALPVYGGRRQQVKYKAVFAMEDLSAAKNAVGRQVLSLIHI